jgi:hypothetical protein
MSHPFRALVATSYGRGADGELIRNSRAGRRGSPMAGLGAKRVPDGPRENRRFVSLRDVRLLACAHFRAPHEADIPRKQRKPLTSSVATGTGAAAALTSRYPRPFCRAELLLLLLLLLSDELDAFCPSARYASAPVGCGRDWSRPCLRWLAAVGVWGRLAARR